MKRPVEITGLEKTFPAAAGPYTAVKDFNLKIEPGEFVCLLGHSGCGKSTVLSILAGLERATKGGIIIEGREVDEPGLDRGVVFQSPSLLPWLDAESNVLMAFSQRHPEMRLGERRKRVRRFLDLAGVGESAHQLPAEMSLGTQQRVAIARALSLEPEMLLLDEPFGMLDSLTRFDLQDTLLEIRERNQMTVVMVTHDVSEALYLSDRIAIMTDGPEAKVGMILHVPFGRPRERGQILKSPEFQALRREILEFLEQHAVQMSRKEVH